MPRSTRSRAAAAEAAGDGPAQAPLRHVMIAGGTLREWGDLPDSAWSERIAALGDAAGRAGARWLTLRPFERGEGAESARPVGHGVVERDGCTVIVDPHPDGRDHLVVAMRKLAESDSLTEASVAPALLAPADVEPDLVLLLGPDDCLPTSLVWELAYAELVYAPVAWRDLGVAELVAATTAYEGRHRRFGGLD